MADEKKEDDQKVGKGVFDTLEMPLLFGKYDMKEVKITDPGLKRYINLTPILVPHSGGQHGNKKFGSSEVSIIELLINAMMRTQKYTGKKMKAYKTVINAMKIINERTEENPVQIFIKAIEHSSPKEETTQIRYGGISVPKAVDVSPSRRISIALSNNAKGAVKSSYKNKRNIAECLANELMNAAKGEKTSFAVSRKEEMERMAQSAR